MFDVDLIHKLSDKNLPLDKCELIAHYGEGRTDPLIPPSKLWREGNSIIVRCEGIFNDVKAIEVRLGGKEIVTLPVGKRELPFGIGITLSSSTKVGWSIGRKK